MLLARRIIFWIFTSVYVLICPLVLLYAFGYVFATNIERGIVKTGLISLSTAPSGANVYLENRRFTNKTPVVIRDLLPGKYTVSVLLKNFQPWSETLFVKAGKATALERILLLPKEWTPVVADAGKFENLFVLEGTNFLLLSKGRNFGDYSAYDLKKGQNFQLLSASSFFRSARVIEFFSVRNSPYLLFHIAYRGADKYLWVELRQRPVQVVDITQHFPLPVTGVSWDEADPENIFILSNKLLSKLNVPSGKFSADFAKDIQGYGLFERMLYLLTEDRKLLRMDYDLKRQEVLYDEAKSGTSIFKESDFLKIKPVTSNIVFFLGEKGELLSNLLPYRFVDKGVFSAEFDPHQKMMLLFSNNKLGVLDLSMQKEEGFFEETPQVDWVFTEGKRIYQAFWVYKNSQILFLDNNKLYFLVNDEVQKSNLRYLFEVKPKTQIFYSELNGRIYYLDRLTGKLSSVTLISEKEAFSSELSEINREIISSI